MMDFIKLLWEIINNYHKIPTVIRCFGINTLILYTVLYLLYPNFNEEIPIIQFFFVLGISIAYTILGTIFSALIFRYPKNTIFPYIALTTSAFIYFFIFRFRNNIETFGYITAGVYLFSIIITFMHYFFKTLIIDNMVNYIKRKL